MKQVAVYTRISRDSARKGEGVARQEKACRELVAKHDDWTLRRVYSDNDLSAYSGVRRPDYERMLSDIEAGNIDVVVCWHTDRLTRRASDLERYITICQPANVPTYTVQSGPLDLTTPSGRMVARTLGAVGQYETEQKGERQRVANQARALKGKHSSTRRCFGYEDDGLTLREVEAEAVRTAAQQLIARQRSFHAIAKEWNSSGLLPAHGKRRTQAEKDAYDRAVQEAIDNGHEPPPRPPLKPSKWTGPTLTTYFKNPRIAGICTYQRKTVRDPDTGEPVTGEWDPILDLDTWNSMLRLIEDNAQHRRFPSAERQLLSGIALCAECGGKMSSGGTRNGRQRYRCREDGGHVYREAQPIDDYVEQVIIARLSQPDVLELLQTTSAEVDVSGTMRELADLDVRESELGTAYAEGLVTLTQLTQANKRFAQQRKSLQEQLPVAPTPAIQELIDAEDVAAMWSTFSQDAQRAVISTLMTIEVLAPGTKERAYLDWRKRIINPESVRVTWK